jgi:hypothetical protein
MNNLALTLHLADDMDRQQYTTLLRIVAFSQRIIKVENMSGDKLLIKQGSIPIMILIGCVMPCS